MSRFIISLLVAIAVSETAEAGAEAAGKAAPARHRSYHGGGRAVANLPAGLPRRHYDFRTTISYNEPAFHRANRPAVSVYEAPQPLLVPVYVEIPFVTPLFGAPLLPGSSTLPGYYGSTYSYDYQGPYYGGPTTPYWDRLPYACGVYSYC